MDPFYLVFVFITIPIAAVAILLPFLFTLLIKNRALLKLLSILYLCLTVYLAITTAHHVYAVYTMNSSEEVTFSNFPDNSKTIHFTASQSGTYTTLFVITDNNIIASIRNCYGNTNEAATAFCSANYSMKNITILSSGIVVPQPAYNTSWLLDETPLNYFYAKQGESFEFKVSIDKKVNAILDSKPYIIIRPADSEQAGLPIPVAMNLAFVLPAIFMLFYLRKKLKLR